MAVTGNDQHGSDARIAELYRNASREEPPAHLDHAIAAAARASASSARPVDRAAWWSRFSPWRVPFAFAAVAVVSVSLVALVMEEGGERIDLPNPLAQALPPAAPEPLMSVPQSAQVVDVPQSATQARGDEADRRASPPPAPQAAPPSAAGDAAPGKAAAEGRAAVGAARDDAAAQRYAVDPPPADVARLESRPFEEQAQRKAPAERTRERDAASADAMAPPPAVAPAPAAAPAPPAAAKPASRPAPRAMQREAASAEASSPEMRRLLVELEREPPAVWAAHIATLRRDGRAAEAEALVAEFRRRFPEEPVPASVK
jgi:hypothetical protein